MRHFNYYPNGGPFPGICAMCGINRDLWDLGFEHYRGGSAMACTVCISELAENIGYAPKQPLVDTIVSRETTIAELEAQLATVPDLTEGFINGVRSSLTDFVFAVSSISNGNRRKTVSVADEDFGADVKGDKPADVSDEARYESFSVQGSTGVSANPNRNKPGRPAKIK